MAEIKDDASFKAWVESAEEKLAKVGTIEDVKSTVESLKADMETMKADFGRRQLPIEGETKRLPVTKEEFAEMGIKAVLDAPVKAVRNQNGTFSSESEDDRIAKFHEASDRLVLLSQVVNGGKHAKDPDRFSRLKYYHQTYLPALTKVLAGLDTSTSGELSQFDPTEYSRSLYEKVRLAKLLPNLFARVDVPRFPFVLPVWSGDIVAGRWAENTAGGIGSSTALPDGNAGSITSSVQLDGRTLAMQLAWSWELDEDSIIPMLPFLERAVVEAITNGQETALINGTLSGTTHIDTDTQAGASTLAEKLFHGLRYYAGFGAAQGTASESAGGNKINTNDLWRDYVGKTRGNMGKYGVNAGDLALIVSPKGINQIRSCGDFRTLYAFGAQATNTTGGVSRPNGGFSPDGFDLVVSEFMREDIDSTGVNTAPGQTYTSFLLVNKKAYVFAETRSISTQVLNELFATYGQKGLVASWRGDFKPVYAATGNHTAAVYAIAT